jgi:predicted nucleic acid-binding protein
MTWYLLDTNHLSAALNADADIRRRLRDLRLRGDRVGTCVPSLCELQAGIALTARREHNQRLLIDLLRQVRLWPLSPKTALLYGELYHELRRAGRALSQVDIMLASLARQMNATLVSTDGDFAAVPGIRTESWLPR